MNGPLLISTMKNEGPYILEWVAYHQHIGFSDFLIYTNDCEDGTVEILERLTEMGVVRHEPNKVLRRGPHKSALKYAFEHPLTRSAEWIMVSDVDEYLNIHIGEGTVQELIAAQPAETDSIPVTWRLFSHDGQTAFRDEPVIAQFTDAERSMAQGGFPDRFVKTVFRKLEQVERLGLHRPVVASEHVETYVSRMPDGTLFDGDMRDAKVKTQFAYDAAQVNHYAVRSIDSFLVKRDRGRANHARQILGADYWQKMCRGGDEDRTILRHLDATQARIAELRRDERLDALHRGAVSWHTAKIEQLRGQPAFEALREEVLELTAGEDHLRLRTEPAMPLRPVEVIDADASTGGPLADEAAARLQPLLKELRDVLDGLEPVEAASKAIAHLDALEQGLLTPAER
ncbi:glycosyltransferase family 2 protein [Pontivivens insulae]|uniref:Glycosyl transferase family 2 n=1 Tax=Pontivivens insulae TaxID=1639689 RepID=A0A2R8A8H8_9RHOB|nr:glycosyltransferase family 2 protein [Pontivivens insulae]RED18430.1 glycosyl transferase family 2 [Pontivivens insulae]SPF28328.1 hypothetical protein POI8812_00626 [Pontivivens insulae]